jgi:hypothetical protein
MQTSEHIHEIAAALAKAQAVIQNPAKDKENPHFKSKYADLASGLDCVRPALSAQGIAFVQPTEITDDGVILRTRLIHASGQWIESTYPVSKFAPHQQLGAALTYAKRQALFALVGICGDDEDDDGVAANAADTSSRKVAPAKREDKGLSDADSAKAADLMLGTLEFCDSEDSLREWGKANKATTLKMTREDQQRITQAYMAKRAEVVPAGATA